MKQAICKLRGVTPVTFGKFHQTEKLPKELHGDFETRTWREKLHVDSNNFVVLPGTMFGNCIRESAKFMSMQIPGKGKATYTKHFEAGIIINNDIVLPIKKEEVYGQPVHVPSDGRAGGTTRVLKIFPMINEWEGTLTVLVGDDLITAEVFEQVIRNAGHLIGIGTFRPRNRGTHGRFELIDMKWE